MLVTMKEALTKANKGNYAIPALVVQTEADVRSCIRAAEEENAPVILLVPYPMFQYNVDFFGRYIAELAKSASVPVVICHDHGPDFKTALECLKANFSAIMVDRSSLPFEDNIEQVSELTKIAHTLGVSVEAELGHVGFAANYDHDSAEEFLTNPASAKEFIDRTGCDCLAVAIGTAHGAYNKGQRPHLDFDRLAEIRKAVGEDFPLVLHGGSGTGDEQLGKAAHAGIAKINIGQELYQSAFESVKEHYKQGNDAYSFANFVSNGVMSVAKHYLELFGAKDQAWK